jgi:hypothetical protein
MNGFFLTYDDCYPAREAIAAGTLVCPTDAATPGCCTSFDPAPMGGPPSPPGLPPGSSVTGGTPGLSSGTVCMRGAAAQVINGTDGMLAYTAQWGFDVALLLNGGAPFDATQVPGGAIVGFALDIDGTAPTTPVLRVGVGEAGVPYYFEEYPVPTHDALVLFSVIQAGFWETDPAPLDLSRIEALTFEIPTTDKGVTRFDFCISNVRVLQAPLTP